jgi:hypothetical protein
MIFMIPAERFPRLAISATVAIATLVLVGCGGGGSSDAAPPPPSGPTLAQRTAAASATEQSGSACEAVRPFYWEIGDGTAAQASGSVTSSSSAFAYTATTPMSIASASKWVYSSYVVQKRAGVLSASDIKYLTFSSGYTSFQSCQQDQTVQECVDYQDNGVYTAADDGKFSYGGGHMEKHASLDGLGPLNNGTLATEIRSRIGSDVALNYSQPQLAGGDTVGVRVAGLDRIAEDQRGSPRSGEIRGFLVRPADQQRQRRRSAHVHHFAARHRVIEIPSGVVRSV